MSNIEEFNCYNVRIGDSVELRSGGLGKVKELFQDEFTFQYGLLQAKKPYSDIFHKGRYEFTMGDVGVGDIVIVSSGYSVDVMDVCEDSFVCSARVGLPVVSLLNYRDILEIVNKAPKISKEYIDQFKRQAMFI